MDFGIWVSVVATVVAVASAAISMHNSRLSVRPVMGFWMQSDGNIHRFILANKGNGPAIIESAAFTPVNFETISEEVKTDADALAFFQSSVAKFYFIRYSEINQALSLSTGRMLGAGEELDIFRFTEKSDLDRFDSAVKEQWSKSFHLTVELRDMFDEKWQVIFKEGKSAFSKNRGSLF